MSDDRYIPGVPCWVDITVPDPGVTLDFYRGLFGWEIEDVMPPEAPARYFVGRIRGGDVAAIASGPDRGPGDPAWQTYVWVTDVEQTAAKVRDAGGTVLAEPFEVSDA